MNAAIIRVDLRVLEELLHLPPDHHVREVIVEYEDRVRRGVRFLIEGPLLPRVSEGAVAPEVIPIYHPPTAHITRETTEFQW
jgi:hypothetical protein